LIRALRDPVRNNRDTPDLYDGLRGPQFGDSDGGPGRVRRLQELPSDSKQEIRMAPETDVVRVDLNDVGPARTSRSKSRADVTKGSAYLLFGILGKHIIR
jgi:hypothetical protein